jgi:hypothetical protein
MKKLLIALFALSVAGVAFAQDATPSLKFSGYINSGLQYVSADTDSGLDEGLNSYAQDAEVKGFRLNLNGAYVNGDAGANFRLRAQGPNTDLNGSDTDGDGVIDDVSYSGTYDVFIKYGYGWANLFEGKAKVKGGIVDDSAWATAGDIGDDVGEGTGVLLQFLPIDGLNVGAGVYAKDGFGTYGGSDDLLDAATFTVGAAYKQADLFAVQGSYKYVDGHADKALFGLDIFAISKATINAELLLEKFQYYDQEGLATIEQLVSYDLSPVEVGVLAYEYLSGNSDLDMGYQISPWISYTSGKLTPKLSVSYANNVDVLDDSYAGAAGDAVVNTLSINPSVKYELNSNAIITGSYEYNFLTEDADLDDNYQKIYIDFVYRF